MTNRICLLFLLMIGLSVSSVAQNPEVLNRYQSVFIHPLDYGKGKQDIYEIKKTLSEKLTSCGITVYLDEQKISGDAMKQPCSMVQCLISHSAGSSSNAAKIKIAFLNCKYDTLLQCESEAKAQRDFQETKNSFIAATKQALAVFDNFHYHYAIPVSSLANTSTDSINKDSIAWNPARKLTWNDFKGNPQESHPADALTYTANASTFDAFSIGNHFHVESIITCFFVKANSWVRKGTQTDYLLNHEQRHFDLSEAGAREYRKRLKNANFTGDNFDDELKKINRQVTEKYDDLQKQYDAESDHSRVESKQNEWNTKIERMLKDLEDYK